MADDAQYFRDRIKEFEAKYRMKSSQFYARYVDKVGRKTLPGYNELPAVDYSEWAFLYEMSEHFQPEKP